MDKAEVSDLEVKLTNMLYELREVLKTQEEQLKVSERRDVIAVYLKEILESNSDFYSLRNAIDEFIRELLQPENLKKEE